MNARHASSRLTAVCSALLVLAAFPSVLRAGRGDDYFAEERRRIRERAEEERRNAARRDEEAKQRISAGKEQGERDLVEIDQLIASALDSMSQANVVGQLWVDNGAREMPPDILSFGKRVSTTIGRIRKERSECGVALHSPNALVSDTLRRIAELKHRAVAVNDDAKLLGGSIFRLFQEDAKKELLAVDDRLAGAIAIINWAKTGIQRLEAEELRAAKEYLKKNLEEEVKAEKRAASPRTRAGSESARRRSSNLTDAKEKMKLRTFDSNEAKMQLNDSIRRLEHRHGDFVRRREAAEKNLFNSRTSFKEDTAEIAVLAGDVDSFCHEVDDLAKLAEPYLGKAPGGKPDETGETGAAVAESGNGEAEGNDPGAKPKTGSGSRFVYSWTPWESSDALSAERR
jgi:hypothetical protein